MPIQAIEPLNLRPVLKQGEKLKYFLSYDNQFTVSPIVEDFNLVVS